jgi:hypothetical protein
MGTKKGQVRKTARRAYGPRNPRYTFRFTRLWGDLAIEAKDKVKNERTTFVPNWSVFTFTKKK